MRIDKYEYVCEGCGCIYDVGKLKFVNTENDIYSIKDEYDILIENAILEGEGICGFIPNATLSDVKSFIPKLMVTYKCPVCNCTVCMPDRRDTFR